ncbi:GNAT family N-acetyltransferase [Marinilactibacillus piezotolerans]|uniref:GNAT family N-acetyltransferase n=1 Tax=Marinilactibacillus piezotolerans TaxID=258723 RepID=UPI0009B14BBD|nr:GNAT family N-acetyltransferase [Marinilactibacillus piezotolerans]
MNTLHVRIIDQENEKDLRLPNESFEQFGEMIVNRMDHQWTYTEKLWTHNKTEKFPQENYSYESIAEQGFAVGLYDKEQCIGLAVLEYRWNQYVYLSDLKINQTYRKQGAASFLMDKVKEIVIEKKQKGITTVAQTDNLAANRFYLKYGFEIGGFNTRDYDFTKLNGTGDIYYYLAL